MSSPLVSVLIPVHNDADFLEECLQSLFQQSYENWELIAVDDGSTDASPAILERWAARDSRVRWQFQEHLGIVPALNLAGSLAKGELIARMDADDLAHPLRLEKQVQFLEQHPEAGLIGCCFEHFVDPSQTSLPPWALRHQLWSNTLLDAEELNNALFAESPVAHPTFCMRQKVFEDLGGYQDAEWAEDYDFLFRARQLGIRFGKVPEVLLQKRFNADCISSWQSRYKQSTNMKAKVHYALQAGFLEGRLWVVGSGGSARSLIQALQGFGICVEGVMDQKLHQGTSRKLEGLPIVGLRHPEQSATWEGWRGDRLLLAVGGEVGDQISRWLESWNWRSPEDYLRLA